MINNRHACFFAEPDYLFYLEWLEEYAREAGCLVHAYVLMTNHVHILLTPSCPESAGRLMKRLGQRYVHPEKSAGAGGYVQPWGII